MTRFLGRNNRPKILCTWKLAMLSLKLKFHHVPGRRRGESVKWDYAVIVETGLSLKISKLILAGAEVCP